MTAMVLVFDYDGTLHDTASLYACAVRKTYRQLAEKGFAEYRYFSDTELSGYLGMTPDEMWHDFMPDLPNDIMQQASYDIGCEMISQIQKGAAHLYTGIEQTLDALKANGYTMVILSNCKNSYMDAHRNYFNLDKWFERCYCAEKYGYIPKEEIFCYIKKDFPDDKYIVIGDRASDIKAAAVHGAVSIGCSYGFGSQEELRNCCAVIDHPDKLLDTIKMFE